MARCSPLWHWPSCSPPAAARGSSGYPVTGTVTWKGQPLDQGSIQFLPEDGKGTMVGAEIRDGRYALPDPPGLAPGSYRVAHQFPERR